MVARAVIYGVLFYIFVSFVLWFFPFLLDSASGLTISFIAAPFLAGYLMIVKEKYELSGSERWSVAALFSGALTLFTVGFMLYFSMTPEGAEIMSQHNVEGNIVTYIVYAFCFLFIFLLYLIANRIGFGLGIKFGKFQADLEQRALQN